MSAISMRATKDAESSPQDAANALRSAPTFAAKLASGVNPKADDATTTAAADSSDSNSPSAVLDRNGITETFNRVAFENVSDSISTLDAHVNIILTFSALFSAAISGTLSLSWPLLSPDPSDQTNYLLALVVHNGDATFPLPPQPANFSPSGQAILVNALITASLTCSLLASFGAVLGKQWILAYGKTTSHVPVDIQQDLQSWLDGGKFWHLHGIIEGVLPLLLEAALVMFIIGLIEFFKIVSPVVSTINYVIAIAGLAAFAISICIALFDPYCPYQTPISQTILPGLVKIFFGGAWIVGTSICSVLFLPLTWVMAVILSLVFKPTSGGDGPLKRVGFIPRATQVLTKFYITAFFGTYFRKWNRLVAHAVRQTQRRPPSKRINCGNTLGWLLEQFYEYEPLKSVVLCLVQVHDPKTIGALSHRKAITMARDSWRESTARMDSAEISNGLTKAREIDMERLGPGILLYEAVILHTFISVEHQSTEQRRCVFKMLKRWNAGMQNDAGVTGSDLDDLESTVQAGYIAACIKTFLHHRTYHRLAVDASFDEDDDKTIDGLCRTICMRPFVDSLPYIHVSLVAWAAATLPRRPSTMFTRYHDPRDMRRRRAEDYSALRCLYGSDNSDLVLSSVIDAINTFCDHSQNLFEPKGELPELDLYSALLRWTTGFVRVKVSTERLLGNALPVMKVLYRLIILKRNSVQLPSGSDGTSVNRPTSTTDGQTIPDIKSIVERIASNKDSLEWESVCLVEALLRRLQPTSSGPFSMKADAMTLQAWDSPDILRLLSICMLVSHHRASSCDEDDDLRLATVYGALAESMKSQGYMKEDSIASPEYFAALGELDHQDHDPITRVGSKVPSRTDSSVLDPDT